MSWDRERLRALDAAQLLQKLLGDREAADVRMTVGYLDAKRTLAEAFQARALERYRDSRVLEEAIALVENGIREAFPELQGEYGRVQGFGAVHTALLGYLADRIGQNVSAEELRILTCDAVHTERRTRDLRDLGFSLLASKTAGRQAYRLVDRVPDVAEGARLIVSKNIRNDKRMSKAHQLELLAHFDLPQS